MVDQKVARNHQKQREPDADQSCTESDDEGFGIEDLRNIAFRSTDRAQDTDLCLTFQTTELCEDAEQNR